MGDYIGDYYRVIKGDTRSLDYSSYRGSIGIICRDTGKENGNYYLGLGSECLTATHMQDVPQYRR